MMSLIEKRPFVVFAVFTVLTFSFSWAVWSPAIPALSADTTQSPGWALALVLLGAASPTLMALLITLVTSGFAGVWALIGKLFRWRVGLQWYLVVFLIPALVYGGGVVVYMGLGGDVGAIRWQNWMLIGFAFLSTALTGPLMEELGWRGFLQPLLFQRFNIFTTGLIIGVLWSVWHIPLFFAEGGTVVGGGEPTIISILQFTALITGFSILMAWVLCHARGSVLLAYFFHMGINARASLWLFADFDASSPEQVQRSLGDALAFQSGILELSIYPLWGLIAVLFLTGALSKKPAPVG